MIVCYTFFIQSECLKSCFRRPDPGSVLQIFQLLWTWNCIVPIVEFELLSDRINLHCHSPLFYHSMFFCFKSIRITGWLVSVNYLLCNECLLVTYLPRSYKRSTWTIILSHCCCNCAHTRERDEWQAVPNWFMKKWK